MDVGSVVTNTGNLFKSDVGVRQWRHSGIRYYRAVDKDRVAASLSVSIWIWPPSTPICNRGDRVCVESYVF